MHKSTLNVSSYILLALSILQSHFRSQCSGYFFPFPYSFPATMPAPFGSSHAPITTTSSMSYGSPLFNMAPYQDKTEVIVVGGGKQDQHHHHHHHHHHKHGHHHSHGHEHAHDHNHNHGHTHGHEHKHDHGHRHNHDHDHKHGHQHDHNQHHEHKHDHNNIHNHNHGHHHSHGHLHGHGHLHDQNHKHSHEHQHGHKHSHGHNHDHKHDHTHGIHNEGHDRLKQQITFQHQNNLANFARHNTDNDNQIFLNDHSEQQNNGMFDDQEGEIKYVPNQDEQSNNNDDSFNGHGFNQNYQELEQIYSSGERNDNNPPHQEQQNEQQNFLEQPENAGPEPELVPLKQKNFILLAKDVQSHNLGKDGQIQSYGVHLGQTELVQDSDTAQDKQESMSILTIFRQNGRIVTLRADDPLVSIEKPLRMKQDYIDITLGSDGLKSRISTGLEFTPDEDYDTSIGKFDAIYNVQEYD